MQPQIVVLSTGGTIASTDNDDGATPSKRGNHLVESVPEVESYAKITTRDVAQTSSFEMDFETARDLRNAVSEAADTADGVVITHGTDTMEESAYFLDSMRNWDVPIVFTGAQRRPDEVSADGPGNLLAAVRAASHEQLSEAGGVYIAFDMELHAARDVMKGHTSALGTFVSPDTGPVASLTRDDIRFHRSPGSTVTPIPVTEPDADVTLIKSATGVDGEQLRLALDRSVDGIVVEGTGLGNTTAPLGRAISEAVEVGIPVVITSRCWGGSTAATYGGHGGGQTLVNNGAILAGDLSAQKARIRLMLALEAVAGGEDADVAAYFD